MKLKIKKIICVVFILLMGFSSLSGIPLRVFSIDEALPAKYSSADYGYIRPAENQYNSNNCWAFTTLGVLSAYSIKHNIHSFSEADYSEAHLAWFNGKSRTDNEDDSMFGDGLSIDSPYDEGSKLFMSTFTLAKGSGIAWEVDYPFEQRNSKMGNYSEFDRYDTSAAILTEAKFLNSVGEIKSAVMEYGAVEAGIYYDESKLNNTVRKKYSNGEYTFSGNCCYLNRENTGEGHEIMIIGWDDSYPKENFLPGNMPKANGAWLCKNSWGNTWGENGFFWISYENGTFENVMTYACIDGGSCDDIYQYDGYGFNRCIAMQNKKTASFGNVFTAENTLTVERVGFYTYQNSLYQNSDSTVKIEIYKNLPEDYASPVFGTPEISLSVFESNSGYHTVELPNSIAVEEGERFSVVITVTVSQGNAVMLLEGNQSDTLSYHAEEGTSFLSFGDSSDFFDTAKKYGGNVCVKAYTRNYEDGTVSAVKISSDDKTVVKGSEETLEAVIKPLGQPGIVEWKSSNNSVVSIDTNGKYSAVGTGEAIITATAEGKSASVKISVIPQNYSSNSITISNNPGVKTIDYGDTLRITAKMSDSADSAFFGWYVDGVKQSCKTDIFELENAKGDVTVTVRLEDKNGNALVDMKENELSDSETVKVNSGFFKKLISFFKNLFRVNRIKEN